MVKDIIIQPGRTFSEFSLLPSHTVKTCKITNTSLETRLAPGLSLGVPFLSAAMTSVTHHEMALALGRGGGIGVLPCRLPISEQAEIARKIKNYELSFVEEPISIRDTTNIETVLKLIDRHGHSTIPIVDRNNIYMGMFIQEQYWNSGKGPFDNVTEAMTAFPETRIVDYLINQNTTMDEIVKLFNEREVKYIVILDNQKRLVKLAFRRDIEEIMVASAISTYEGWQDRVRVNIDAGTDMIVLDTSDAYNDFVKDVLVEYKNIEPHTPICAGNIVTYEGAMFLMQNNADCIKVGMSSGSICITQREKATGRAPMTALIEAGRARQDFLEETGKYVPIIIDGGLSCVADMILALTISDAIMMGNYFNRFYEAAGEKYDSFGTVTRYEEEMVDVGMWGEGSEKAKNLERYGHSAMRTFFPEGIEGTVKYAGRLKPNLQKDILKIKAALSNAGCPNLEEFRKNSTIELNSPYTSLVVSTTHDVNPNK